MAGSFDKFIDDITKREASKKSIKEADETPQERLLRRSRENHLHKIKWSK